MEDLAADIDCAAVPGGQTQRRIDETASSLLSALLQEESRKTTRRALAIKSAVLPPMGTSSRSALPAKESLISMTATSASAR